MTGSALTILWRHGAPGIGLSRIRAFQLLAGAESLEKTKAAVASASIAIKQAIQLQNGNYSLCHGVAGNADLLIEAHKIGKVGADIDLVNEAAQFGIHRYVNEQRPWPCGVLGGGETPSSC